jgi:hypothetical protein
MNDITEIQNALLHAGPGTTIEILNYHDSEGAVKDMRVELLPADAYATWQKEDLQRLRAADISAMSDLGDLQATDMLAAKEQLIASREKSLAQRESALLSAYRGADYAMLTDSISTLPGTSDVLYLMRLKALHEPGPSKPAKGAIPRAKQELTRRLNLPTRHYIHTLKLENGKVEDLRIEQLVPR